MLPKPRGNAARRHTAGCHTNEINSAARWLLPLGYHDHGWRRETFRRDSEKKSMSTVPSFCIWLGMIACVVQSALFAGLNVVY
jgi:hypothetical protein